MDAYAPVANTGNPVQPSHALQTMSSIMGLMQQKKALEKQSAETYEAQMSAQGLKNIMPILQDPVKSGVTDEEGNPTKDAQRIITSADPMNGAARFDQYMKAAQSRVAFNSARNNLSADERGMFGSSVAGIVAGAKEPGEVESGIDNFLSSVKGTPVEKDYQTLADTFKTSLKHVTSKAAEAKGPDGNPVDPMPAIRQLGGQYGRAVLGAPATVGASGIAAPSGGTLDTGGSIQPIVQQPPVQGGGVTTVGAPIPKTVPPQPQVVTDANGRQFRYNPQNNQLEPLGAGGGGAAPTQSPRFTQPIPNQADAQKSIEATRSADADYGLNRHINNTILRLSKSTDTGPGTEFWHHALGGVAGPLGGNNVADFQTIGAMLDRQAALAARQMGLPDTNAGLATAASLSGTTSYQPEALQTKVRLTDSLIEGAHKYRQGLDRVIGTGPNQDLSKYQAYRAAWSQNFDPTVFALDNAHARHDKEEVKTILKDVTPDQAAVLAKKAANLRLLEQGKIPE